MKNNNILIGLLVVAGIAAFFVFQAQRSGPVGTEGEGRVVFAVTDAAASLEGISAVDLTVSKVEAQSAASGWVTVSSAAKTFDLLELKGSGDLALLADVTLPEGTYNQIRLTVDRVVVTASGEASVAILPSNVLRFANRFVVEADGTSSVVLDFLLDRSLHLTGNGRYVFAPVVRVVTRRGVSASVLANGRVQFSGGVSDADETSGMDANGEMRANFEIDADAEVEVDANGMILIDGEAQGGAGADADADFGGHLELSLSAQNNSGLSGSVVLDEIDGGVKVDLTVSGGAALDLALAKPAHIHAGSCAELGAVVYPLNNVVAGRSTTVVDTTFAALRAELPLAINVHRSVAEASMYVACADLEFAAE